MCDILVQLGKLLSHGCSMFPTVVGRILGKSGGKKPHNLRDLQRYSHLMGYSRHHAPIVAGKSSRSPLSKTQRCLSLQVGQHIFESVLKPTKLESEKETVESWFFSRVAHRKILHNEVTKRTEPRKFLQEMTCRLQQVNMTCAISNNITTLSASDSTTSLVLDGLLISGVPLRQQIRNVPEHGPPLRCTLELENMAA